MKLSHSTAVVSPVVLELMVRWRVTTLSQPFVVSYVCVGATAGVDVYVFPCHVKLSHSTAVVSPLEEWLMVR